MGRYVTVSAEVERELLEEARRLNVNISQVVGRALEEVRRCRLMMLEERLRGKSDVLARIDIDEVVRLIREDREAG